MQSSSWALSWLVMAYVMMAHAAAQAVALLALDLVALLAAHSLGAWALSCRALPWLQVLAIVISPVTMSGESRLLCATASSALLLHHSIQRLGSQRHCTSDTIAFVILQLVLCPSTCFAPSSSSSVSDFFPRPSGLHWMLCCAIVFFGAALGRVILELMASECTSAEKAVSVPTTPAMPTVPAGSSAPAQQTQPAQPGQPARPAQQTQQTQPALPALPSTSAPAPAVPDAAAALDPGPASPPGTGLIDWEQIEVLHQIGRGAYGSVFAVRYFGSMASLKFMHRNQTSQQCLRRETELMLTLRHPHVCSTLGFVSDGLERHGLLMELMAKSLEQLLKDDHKRQGGGKLTHVHGAHDEPSKDLLCWTSPLLRIALQVAQGMYYLHGRHVIHGDLKAANVMLGPEPLLQVKLVDFGEARRLEQSPSGTFMGRELSERADVWSFGGLLVHLERRQPPFNPAPPLPWLTSMERGEIETSWPPALGTLALRCSMLGADCKGVQVSFAECVASLRAVASSIGVATPFMGSSTDWPRALSPLQLSRQLSPWAFSPRSQTSVSVWSASSREDSPSGQSDSPCSTAPGSTCSIASRGGVHSGRSETSLLNMTLSETGLRRASASPIPEWCSDRGGAAEAIPGAAVAPKASVAAGRCDSGGSLDSLAQDARDSARDSVDQPRDERRSMPSTEEAMLAPPMHPLLQSRPQVSLSVRKRRSSAEWNSPLLRTTLGSRRPSRDRDEAPDLQIVYG